nr:MAG TPA: hypothetical protein [Caudoviricetes sp.]
MNNKHFRALNKIYTNLPRFLVYRPLFSTGGSCDKTSAWVIMRCNYLMNYSGCIITSDYYSRAFRPGHFWDF